MQPCRRRMLPVLMDRMDSMNAVNKVDRAGFENRDRKRPEPNHKG